MHFLGIDIGTSAVKAVLVDEAPGAPGRGRGAAGHLAARGRCWSEQDPDDWWARDERRSLAAPRARRRLRAAVRAIGLSGQMHGAVAARRGRPAAAPGDPVERRPRRRPSARRSQSAIPDLGRHRRRAAPCRASRRRSCSGCARTSRSSSPGSRTVLLPKDYVRLRLTGEHVTDLSDAAGTLLARRGAPRLVAPSLAAPAARPDARCRGSSRAGAGGRAAAGDRRRAGACRAGIVVAGGAGDAAAGADRHRRGRRRRRLRLARHLGAVLRHHRPPTAPIPRR